MSAAIADPPGSPPPGAIHSPPSASMGVTSPARPAGGAGPSYSMGVTREPRPGRTLGGSPTSAGGRPPARPAFSVDASRLSSSSSEGDSSDAASPSSSSDGEVQSRRPAAARPVLLASARRTADAAWGVPSLLALLTGRWGRRSRAGGRPLAGGGGGRARGATPPAAVAPSPPPQRQKTPPLPGLRPSHPADTEAAAAAAARTADAAAAGAAQVAALDARLAAAGADAAAAAAAGVDAVSDVLAAVAVADAAGAARAASVTAAAAEVAARLQAARSAVARQAAAVQASAAAAAAAEDAAAAAARAAADAAKQAQADKEAARRAAQEKAAADEAARVEAAAAAAAAEAAAAAPPPPRVSAGAAAAAAEGAAALAAARAAGEALAAAGPGAAAEKRRVAKFITLQVTQVAGSVSQVRAKAGALSSALSSLGEGPARTHGLHTLAARLAAQCEAQVALHPASAFPLADVAAAVAAAHPGFDTLLRARLAAACPLTIPRYQPAGGKLDDDAFFAANGYVKVESRGEKGDGPPTQVWESTDAWCGRVRGFTLFLGALPAAAGAPPSWPAQGWAYLARLLNALPANRGTATALDGFLWAGGAALSAVYGVQFTKLLASIESSFLPALASGPDAEDARAVAVRLRSYIHGGGWRTTPEGRDLPETDASASERA